MIITLKRAGTCRQCGATLEAGSRAKWYRNGAVYGLECHTDERSTPRGHVATTRRVSWKETARILERIEWRRNAVAFSRAHTNDPAKQAELIAASKAMDAETTAAFAAYYRTNPEKAGHLTAAERVRFGLDPAGPAAEVAAPEAGTDVEIDPNPTQDHIEVFKVEGLAGYAARTRPSIEDYPCSDRGYEDQCAEAVRR